MELRSSAVHGDRPASAEGAEPAHRVVADYDTIDSQDDDGGAGVVERNDGHAGAGRRGVQGRGWVVRLA